MSEWEKRLCEPPIIFKIVGCRIHSATAPFNGPGFVVPRTKKARRPSKVLGRQNQVSMSTIVQKLEFRRLHAMPSQSFFTHKTGLFFKQAGINNQFTRKWNWMVSHLWALRKRNGGRWVVLRWGRGVEGFHQVALYHSIKTVEESNHFMEVQRSCHLSASGKRCIYLERFPPP
jgi:hypothetical protein